MALDLLLVDRESQLWWLVPFSGMGAVCVGEFTFYDSARILALVKYAVLHIITCTVQAINVVISLQGMLYPLFVSETAADAPDGAKVIRCVAVFVGIYQASNVSY